VKFESVARPIQLSALHDFCARQHML